MKKSTFPKILKIVFIVIGAIVLLIVGALIFISQDAGNVADKILRDQFANSDLSRAYRLDFKDVEVKPFSGNLIIKELSLVPDSGIYGAHDSILFQFPMLYRVKVPKIVVKGFNPETGFDLDEISFESVSIQKPEVRLIDYLTKEKKQALRREYAEKQEQDTSQKQPTPRLVEIDAFDLRDGKFEFYDHSRQKIIFYSETIRVNVDSLNLKPAHLMASLLKKKFSKAVVALGGLHYKLENGFYHMQLGEFSWSLHDNLITLNHFEMIPQYDTTEFGKQFGRQTDRMDLQVKELQIHQLNIERLAENGGIETPLIRIIEPDLWIYRDKNVPLDRSRYPKLPHQAIGAAAQYIKIDKIELQNGHVKYEELATDAQKAGTVPIENLYASIYQVTNDMESIRKSGPMKWDVQGVFFNEGSLKVEVSFPADLQQESFTFSGNIGEMNMPEFNSITVTNEHIRIEEGQINRLEFDADAGPEYATGTMLFNYDNLKLSILKNEAKAGNEELGLLSSLANVVIRSFNPGKKSNKSADPAEIFFERDKNKSIFNYLAKTLISGIKATIIPGFSLTKDKYDRQQKRQEKKDARQEKREERKNRKP